MLSLIHRIFQTPVDMISATNASPEPVESKVIFSDSQKFFFTTQNTYTAIFDEDTAAFDLYLIPGLHAPTPATQVPK